MNAHGAGRVTARSNEEQFSHISRWNTVNFL